MKPRVLIFINSFHTGGSERQAVQLVKLLHKDRRCEVFTACLSREGVLLREFEEMGIENIPEFSLTSFYDANFLRQIRRCAALLRENKIQIVQASDFYTNVFSMAASTLAKTPLKIAAKRETDGMRSRAQKFVEKLAFRQANRIVANSGAVKNYLIADGIAAEKIKVIYNGLDLQRLMPQMTDRKKICASLGLPADENLKFITSVANMRHVVKNQPMLIRAAKQVVEKFPNAHFVFAGEGELQNELKNLAKASGVEKNTHFIGRCEKIPELLVVSFACVLTSFHEGFSNSILEYMAAGKPVVATDVGGAKEAIVENETGFLVRSDDDKMLANYLLKLLRDETAAQKFGALGRKIIEEKFSLGTQLRETLELYGL